MPNKSGKGQLTVKSKSALKKTGKNEVALVDKSDKLAVQRANQRALIIPRSKFRVEMVSTHSHAAKAVSKLVKGAHEAKMIFGVDLQWNRDPLRFKGRIPQKPVLIQIGRSDGYCALFRLDYMGILPKEVKLLLKNPEILKVGIGILYDAHLIKSNFSCITASALDLRHVAFKLGIEPLGFDYLSKSVLGLDREFFIPTGDCWTNEPYFNPQKRYAAAGAVNCAQIFDKLNNALITQRWGNAWEDWTPEEYFKTTYKIWKRYYDLPFYNPNPEF